MRVIPVKNKSMSKPLWFDPIEFEIKTHDNVIVETKRGVEFATAVSDVIEITDDQFNEIGSELKPVLRIATSEDVSQNNDMDENAALALPIFKQMVNESGLDMVPVSVEFLHDGKKAVFSFEAEERVDFRELIRKLTQEFKVRVDMRQIGARDKSRIIGGIAHCGQELCCTRFGGEFKPMSIRMAKEQDLSLSPQKISGCCGRLMCCLRYEFEAYKEYKSLAPKFGAKIECGDQQFRVCSVDMPTSTISLKGEDGKTLKIPLTEFKKKNEDDARPNMISVSTYEQYSQDNPMEVELDSSWLITKFKDEPSIKPAGCPDCRCAHGNAHGHGQANNGSGPSGSASVANAGQEKDVDGSKSKNTRRRRPTRNTENRQNSSEQRTSGEVKASSQRKPRRSGKAPASTRVNDETTVRTVVRPGQKSSAIRQSVKSGDESASNSHERPQRKPRAPRNSSTAANGDATPVSTRRKPRERTRKNAQD